MKKAFQKVAVSTDLLWMIANSRASKQEHKKEEVLDLLNCMYPGINYWHTEMNQIALNIAAPDLKRIFPALTKTNMSSEIAIKEYGETVEVPMVKPCKGNEWIDKKWQMR